MLKFLADPIGVFCEWMCTYPPLIDDEKEAREGRQGSWFTRRKPSKWMPGKGPQKPDWLKE